MKRLFNENDQYIEIANQLASAVSYVINDIFREYINLGYSVRDISHVINSDVTEREIIHVLGWDKANVE